MNCAKIIGKTYSNFMHPFIRGVDIKILQEINVESGKPTGKPFFAADPLGVALGEFVAYEESFQATWAFENHMIPIDRAVIAIVDSLDIEPGLRAEPGQRPGEGIEPKEGAGHGKEPETGEGVRSVQEKGSETEKKPEYGQEIGQEHIGQSFSLKEGDESDTGQSSR